MGKIRVKTIGDEEKEQKQKAEAKKRKEAKIAEAKATNTSADTEQQPDPITEVTETAKVTESVGKTQEEPAKTKSKYKEKKSAAGKKPNRHSGNYLAAIAKLDKNKTYKISEAIELLAQFHLAKFDETVELHINTLEKGISGSTILPHGTGKKTKVVIATDQLISDIEAGNISFDILLAQPQMMPKLAKVARILGPRGLMPNPKNGTVTANPEETAKKYEGGQVNFKTEAKFPIIHLSIGKLSFEGKKLKENYDTIIGAIGQAKIKNIILKSTMSPAINVQT